MAPAGAGGAAARGGRFFEKKLRKKLFYGEKFLWVDVDGANRGGIHSCGMARPVFAVGKDRSARSVSSRGPFFFGRN